jgi:hypothetical protein
MEVLGERHRRSVWKAAAPTNRRRSGVGDVLLPATGAAEDRLLVRRGIADAPTVTGTRQRRFMAMRVALELTVSPIEPLKGHSGTLAQPSDPSQKLIQ